MIRICFHGAESTGKSVLAERLGYPWVPEYGRSYCEARGVQLTMADLLAIAEGQNAAQKQVLPMAGAPPLLILDTDPMLFGDIPDVLMAYDKADLYLLFAADVPWVEDGTRFFGTTSERAKFAAIAEAILVTAGVAYQRISGDWAQREAQVRAVIAGITPLAQASV
jgi:nicotinamide riboside kinase